MSLSIVKQKLTIGMLAVLVATVTALVPAIPAAAYTDGLSFVNCEGRFSMGSVSVNGGTVTAYGCSNGYFYVVTRASFAANNMAATLVRSNPNGQEVKSGNNTYQVITNMLARINGACYNVYGSINGSGKGWRFCW